MLADATLAGASEAGHAVELVCLADHVEGLIRDCRSCRRADGDCSIDDGLRELLTGRLLAADAWVYATPLYWYGISSILKAFIDRLFCYTAKSYPHSDTVIAALMQKRSAALISAEESEVGAYLPTLQHLQELSRYLHHDFVGAVIGVGNRRGEVEADANRPLDAAHELGMRLFDSRVTDYHLDTDRPSSVWSSWSGLRRSR
jgi:multimeric flavodoxin WrbA